MEKGTVLMLSLLKPVTKTSQLNDIPVMIYHGGIPVLTISIPFFLPYFDENFMKDMKIKKRNCIIIENNDKNKSTKWIIQGRFFQTCTQSQIAFQDGSLKVSFHGL